MNARRLSGHMLRMLAATALMASAWTAGCALLKEPALKSAPGEHAETTCGRVMLDGRTSGRLLLTEHTWRRDTSGRLVVAGRFQNDSGKAYKARLRVAFADAEGRWEKGSYSSHPQVFPSGLTAIEWTSSTPAAATYTVEVWSDSLLPW